MITQDQMMALADRRADLNLQISLLPEHEITRLVAMVREIRQSVGIESAHSSDLDELKKDVAPEHVLDKIKETEAKANKGKI